MAPLTGIAFASNWLINRLNLNCDAVKTTKMTTNSCWLPKASLNASLYVLIVLRCSLKRRIARTSIKKSARSKICPKSYESLLSAVISMGRCNAILNRRGTFHNTSGRPIRHCLSLGLSIKYSFNFKWVFYGIRGFW